MEIKTHDFMRRRGQGSGQEPQQEAKATWRTGSGRGAVGQHGWRTALCREVSQHAARGRDSRRWRRSR